MTPRRDALVDGLVGGAVAAVVSGAPSTLHALATRRPVLDTVRAAGSLLAGPDASMPVLVAAAVPAHLAISAGWGAALGLALPRRREAWWGGVAGLAVAALDLGVVGRRRPRIRALPLAPQLLDHVAFGAVAGAVVSRRRHTFSRSDGRFVR